jgi:hypothetical protein
VVYQGQITDTTLKGTQTGSPDAYFTGLCTGYTAGQADAKMRSSNIQIKLDPASGLVTGGSLSLEMDITSMRASDLSSNPTMIEVTDVCSFTSAQPATGFVVRFPDGAGGHVTFFGTQIYGIDTYPGQARGFGFVIDATGQQLMLCPFQEDAVTTSPDAQTRQTCATNAVVVLERIP